LLHFQQWTRNKLQFDEVACCGLKHNTPCGVAIGQSVLETYKKAYDCDPMSIFGGIVAFNKKVDKKGND